MTLKFNTGHSLLHTSRNHFSLDYNITLLWKFDLPQEARSPMEFTGGRGCLLSVLTWPSPSIMLATNLLWASEMLVRQASSHSTPPQSYEVGAIITPTLQLGKLRPRESIYLREVIWTGGAGIHLWDLVCGIQNQPSYCQKCMVAVMAESTQCLWLNCHGILVSFLIGLSYNTVSLRAGTASSPQSSLRLRAPVCPIWCPSFSPQTQEKELNLQQVRETPLYKRHTFLSPRQALYLLFCHFFSILRLPWFFLLICFCLDKSVLRVCTYAGVTGVEHINVLCWRSQAPPPRNGLGSPLQSCGLPRAPEHIHVQSIHFDSSPKT